MSLLQDLYRGGWLRTVDHALGESLRRLRPDTPDAVLAAAALCSRALAQGHSQLPLSWVRELLLDIAPEREAPELPPIDEWLAMLRASPWCLSPAGAGMTATSSGSASRQAGDRKVVAAEVGMVMTAPTGDEKFSANNTSARATVVVLPVPGPPVSSRKCRLNSARAALACARLTPSDSGNSSAMRVSATTGGWPGVASRARIASARRTS